MRYLVTLFFIVSTVSLLAQNGIQFSQYIFNSQAINPAYFNHRSPISAQLVSRVQWLSYSGVPNTNAVMGQYNLRGNHTIGLMALNDNISAFNKFQISGSYGYRINLGEKTQLSFGVRMGYSNQTANISGYLTDKYDPTLYSRRSVHHFSLGAGLYMANDRFMLGLSAPDLFNNGLAQQGLEPKVDGGAYHFLLGVKVFQSKEFMFYPSMLVSMTPNAPLHATLDMNFLIQNGLWISLGATTNISANVGLGYLFDNGLRFVYTYGFSFGPYEKRGGGVHELTIGYSKDLFTPDFARRKKLNGKGSVYSKKKQRRKFK